MKEWYLMTKEEINEIIENEKKRMLEESVFFSKMFELPFYFEMIEKTENERERDMIFEIVKLIEENMKANENDIRNFSKSKAPLSF